MKRESVVSTPKKSEYFWAMTPNTTWRSSQVQNDRRAADCNETLWKYSRKKQTEELVYILTEVVVFTADGVSTAGVTSYANYLFVCIKFHPDWILKQELTEIGSHVRPTGMLRSWRTIPSNPNSVAAAGLPADWTLSQHWTGPVLHYMKNIRKQMERYYIDILPGWLARWRPQGQRRQQRR